jgi:prephenate dehydrogenase
MAPRQPRISILGFGAFGRLAATHLAPHATLTIHDPRLDPHAPSPIPDDAPPATLEEAARAEWIVLATPVQAMEPALRSLAPHLAPGTVVIDVGSVKVRPVRWMLDILPGHTQILGTHPMFGPETAREQRGIAGEPLVLCRARADDETFERARAFLSGPLALRVIEMTPDEHDREAALVQGVTHLIGHAAAEMGLPELETGTLAYRRLLQMKLNTERDSPELFAAIQGLNPYAAQARRDFLGALIRIIGRLEKDSDSDG